MITISLDTSGVITLGKQRNGTVTILMDGGRTTGVAEELAKLPLVISIMFLFGMEKSMRT